MLNRTVIDLIPENSFYGFDHLMFDMLASNRPPHVWKHSGYWLDIGRPDDYRQAIDMFEKNGHQFLTERKK